MALRCTGLRLREAEVIARDVIGSLARGNRRRNYRNHTRWGIRRAFEWFSPDAIPAPVEEETTQPMSPE